MADEYELSITQRLPDGTLKLYFANKTTGSVPAITESGAEIMAKAAQGGDVDPALAAAAVVAMQEHHAGLSEAVAGLEERHEALTGAVAALTDEHAELTADVEAAKR